MAGDFNWGVLTSPKGDRWVDFAWQNVSLAIKTNKADVRNASGQLVARKHHQFVLGGDIECVFPDGARLPVNGEVLLLKGIQVPNTANAITSTNCLRITGVEADSVYVEVMDVKTSQKNQEHATLTITVERELDSSWPAAIPTPTPEPTPTP